MKLTLLSIAGIILLVVFAVAYKLTAPTPAPQTPETASAPVATQGGVVSTINVVQPSATPAPNASSSTAAAKSILQDPDLAKDPVNPGYYYLGYHLNQGTTTDSTATSTPPYIIEYIDATHYFNIALLQEPIGPTRQAAEQYLMLHLGLSQDQMCQLSYMVSVPQTVNNQFSGQDLKFSFCPGAIPLPQ